MFEKLLALIGQYDTVIIHRHKNPDGDALGAQIGLKHLLRANFPAKTILAVGDGAGRFSFMEDAVMDTVEDSTYANALAIILDTSASALISDSRYTTAAATARIDHHLFCEKIADVEIVDTSYESCCGLITALAMEACFTLPTIAAKSLYTGMVTDSGRFRYDSTTTNTHRLAAFLRECDFDTNEIFRNLYADDFSFIRLRAQFVLNIRFTRHNVAYIYTTKEELASYGVEPSAISRGMVNTMGEIRGVDIWVNFTETENDGVWCELRSSRYNINPVAVKYGGGGHEKASGATVKNREEAMRLLSDLDRMIEEG